MIEGHFQIVPGVLTINNPEKKFLALEDFPYDKYWISYMQILKPEHRSYNFISFHRENLVKSNEGGSSQQIVLWSVWKGRISRVIRMKKHAKMGWKSLRKHAKMWRISQLRMEKHAKMGRICQVRIKKLAKKRTRRRGCLEIGCPNYLVVKILPICSCYQDLLRVIFIYIECKIK